MVRPLDEPSTPVLVSAIRANQFESFRYLGRSPQAERNDDPPVAWLLTGIAHPFMNSVLSTHLTADDVDDGIANVLSHFASRRVPHFSWWINQDCRPAGLAEHLSGHGLLYTDRQSSRRPTSPPT